MGAWRHDDGRVIIYAPDDSVIVVGASGRLAPIGSYSVGVDSIVRIDPDGHRSPWKFRVEGDLLIKSKVYFAGGKTVVEPSRRVELNDLERLHLEEGARSLAEYISKAAGNP
ncbi:hypothetical protein ACFL5T_04905 [Gemmatimonadota bacterium]